MIDVRQRERRADDRDRFGFEGTESRLAAYAGTFVPQWLARRAVAVSVTTDRERYAVGEPVEIPIEFRNRFRVPVTVHHLP